ncbi:MAG: hypothetical protein L3J49_12670 [Desulfobulbaceae bacterium]|nr:hypothetical protein [Desulfobulbaceae bacterium]
MWWNGHGWGHMYGGWWLMPFLGLLCMLVFLYAVSKIFGNGPFCHRPYPPIDDHESINSLKKEIQELRREIHTLRANTPDPEKKDAS